MLGALLLRGGEGFWAPSLSQSGAALTPPHLRCPVERLARGPHLLAPERADWLLRARIYSASPLSPSGWGLVKVAAKRHSHVSAAELSKLRAVGEREGAVLSEVALPPPARFTRLSEPPFPSVERASAWLLKRTEEHNAALRLQGRGQTSPLIAAEERPLITADERPRRWRGAHRAVGALLLDGSLRPWALAFKQPDTHPLYHAEWALLDALLRERPSLDGALTLISTLKPCKMCAGAWVSYGPKPLSVHYVSDDLGKMGQNTALDVGSFAWSEAGALTQGCAQVHSPYGPLRGAPHPE